LEDCNKCTEKEVTEKIGNNGVIIFYAKWCGHCHEFIEKVKKFESDNKINKKVYLVDVDERPDLAKKYNVDKVPHIVE
jgi:thioredoxin-like negative regulator of GroEL